MPKPLLLALFALTLGACAAEPEPTATVADTAPDVYMQDTPLTRLPPPNVSLNLVGYFTYFADAAIFRECTSREVLPVLMEQDYLALERAYTSLRSEDIEPIRAEVIGRVVWHAAMEGPDRYHLLVERFIALDKTASCSTAVTPTPHNMP